MVSRLKRLICSLITNSYSRERSLTGKDIMTQHRNRCCSMPITITSRELSEGSYKYNRQPTSSQLLAPLSLPLPYAS